VEDEGTVHVGVRGTGGNVDVEGGEKVMDSDTLKGGFLFQKHRIVVMRGEIEGGKGRKV